MGLRARLEGELAQVEPAVRGVQAGPVQVFAESHEAVAGLAGLAVRCGQLGAWDAPALLARAARGESGRGFAESKIGFEAAE